MAYTPAPETQTYSTHRVPLAYDIMLRPGNNSNSQVASTWGQDAGMVNILPVRYAGSQELYGLTRPSVVGNAFNGSSQQVRGMYVWEKSAGVTYYFLIINQQIWTASTSPTTSSSWTNVNTLTTVATTPVRFTEFIDASNVKKLVLVDGVEGYVFTTNAAGTKIVSANFPTPHVPFPVFLNGRLYLAKSATGDIYCSDLNDPSLWTAGNFISTEVYPDDVQALVKIENYILAIGLYGSEYFYDNANPTGSPLARYGGGILPFGCLQPNSIAYNKNTVVLLANSGEGQANFKVLQGFKYDDIDSRGVLNCYVNRLNNVGFAVDPQACRGFFFRYEGLLYYGFHFDGVRGGTNQAPAIDGTFAYSFETKTWTELQFGNDATNRNNRYALPINCSATPTTNSSNTYVAGTVGASGQAFFAQLGNFGQDNFGAFYNSNISISIYQEVRTPNMDFGINNQKNMHRVSCDVEGSSDNSITLLLQYNDYDYGISSWSTQQSLIINPASSLAYFPFLTQLGNFRRRAFRVIAVTSGQTLRWKTMEFDINKGLS